MTDLDALFAPRGIAVLGTSRNAGKPGAAMARSLGTFDGPVALVNPRDPGMYPSVAAAVAAADRSTSRWSACRRRRVSRRSRRRRPPRVRAALVCAGGFAEVGSDGDAYQRKLLEVAAGYGIRILGPNTSGFLVPSRRLTASFVPGAADVPAGRVAVVAASGGVNHALAHLLAEAGHLVSLAVGLGNAADVTAADVLDYLGLIALDAVITRKEM